MPQCSTDAGAGSGWTPSTRRSSRAARRSICIRSGPLHGRGDSPVAAAVAEVEQQLAAQEAGAHPGCSNPRGWNMNDAACASPCARSPGNSIRARSSSSSSCRAALRDGGAARAARGRLGPCGAGRGLSVRGADRSAARAARIPPPCHRRPAVRRRTRPPVRCVAAGDRRAALSPVRPNRSGGPLPWITRTQRRPMVTEPATNSRSASRAAWTAETVQIDLGLDRPNSRAANFRTTSWVCPDAQTRARRRIPAWTHRRVRPASRGAPPRLRHVRDRATARGLGADAPGGAAGAGAAHRASRRGMPGRRRRPSPVPRLVASGRVRIPV